MAKKQPRPKRPMVSSITARIKNTIYDNTVEEVATKQETIERKRNFLHMLDLATQQISENLENGKVQLDTSLDIERIMKLTLLVSGEADSISGKSGQEITQETELQSTKLSMSKIEQILSLDDPEVKAMYDKLYESYNQINDAEE